MSESAPSLNMTRILTTANHDRDVAGLKYVYPVLSRRAGGLSIGVNFNINNACNWRCVYCQVPDLIRGSAPELDFKVLDDELRFFLNDVLQGDFYDRFSVESENRTIQDIAVSGNGEPTSVQGFSQALSLIGALATQEKVFPESRFVLITNGSLIHQPKIQEGLSVLNGFGGEVWFKLDSATREGRWLFNKTGQSIQKTIENIRLSAGLCVTKLQTCMFKYNGQGLSQIEKSAYLETLRTLKKSTNIDNVMLYTLARPSLQPEARLLQALSIDEMNEFADAIRSLGFNVSVSC